MHLGANAGYLVPMVIVIVLGAMVLLLVITIWSIVAGILLIIAGAGIWRRRSFSRWLTLVLGAISGVLAMPYSYALLEGDPLSLVGVVVHGGYCALVFVVLCNRKNAAEFS